MGVNQAMSYLIGGKSRSRTYTGEEKGGLDPYGGDVSLLLPITGYHMS